MKQFDIIVVGCGPAGAAAAATAARSGLRVCVIDAKPFPRNKLCGGLITGRSRGHYARIFQHEIDPALISRKTDISFFLGGRSLGELSDVPPLDLTMRWDFDNAMYQQAIAAGAFDMTGQAVADLDHSGRMLTLKSGEVLQFGVLIGADGVNSQIARHLFGAAFDRNTIGFGLEVEARGPAFSPKAPIRIDIAAADWGYGWSFPKPDSTTIGVGGVMARNGDMKPAMAQYMAQLGVDPETVRIKGQFLPFGDFRKKPGQGAVLLAGDAAGLVDPITGEGIAHALYSGEQAALAAVQALEAGAPEQALRHYRRRLKPIHRSLRMARLIRPLFYIPFLQRRFEPAFRGSTTLKHQYMALLAGDAEYGQILRRLLRKLPALAMIRRDQAADDLRKPPC